MIRPNFPIVGLEPRANAIGYEMRQGESALINLNDRPIHGARATGKVHGFKVPTLAVIQAGEQAYTVLDTRKTEIWEPPLLVVEGVLETIDSASGIGLQEGLTATVGRKHHKDTFTYDPSVSREHFTLLYDGLRLAVTNLKSASPTVLSGNVAYWQTPEEDDGIRADFTQAVQDYLKGEANSRGEKDAAAPYDYYKGHPVIGRDSPTLKNGVYLTPSTEAVIVDDESDALQQARQLVRDELRRDFRYPAEAPAIKVLESVNRVTRQLLAYSDAVSDRLGAPHYGRNGLINLSDYIQAGGGVCRHQCLLAAHLIESLTEDGTLPGQAGVERNHDVPLHSAHAWAVLKIPNEDSLVVDPAQNFIGSKSEARQQGHWKYDLPDPS